MKYMKEEAFGEVFKNTYIKNKFIHSFNTYFKDCPSRWRPTNEPERWGSDPHGGHILMRGNKHNHSNFRWIKQDMQRDRPRILKGWWFFTRCKVMKMTAEKMPPELIFEWWEEAQPCKNPKMVPGRKSRGWRGGNARLLEKLLKRWLMYLKHSGQEEEAKARQRAQQGADHVWQGRSKIMMLRSAQLQILSY